MTEDELIERFFAASTLHRDDVVLGIGDDAAVLAPPPGHQIVSAVDTINEGVHFPAGLPARSIGHRAMAVNLSDLAAMGAEPAWALLSLSIPQADEKWLNEFADGFLGLATGFGVSLVGGDTVRGPLSVSVGVQGFVESGSQLTRAGARPGDAIFLTGKTGEAAAGLELVRGSRTGPLVDRFLDPVPRVEIGRDLVGVATSAIDVSDGLAVDLARLAKASGVAAHLDLDRLPLSEDVDQLFGPERCRELALAGGDDYELCFTVPPSRKEAVRGIEQRRTVPMTCIGEVRTGCGLLLEGKGASAGVPDAWHHFSAVPA
ncbi:MAG: thiamine-phosphate kinase [Gammaproteobacteria bacterium]